MTTLFPLKTARTVALAGLAAALLSGCNAIDRLSNIGSAPDLAKIQNPTEQPGYQPVSMPMPAPRVATRQPNSLWQEGSRAFFKDQRAADVGDLITVVVDIDNDANFTNETSRTRSNTDSASLGGFFGYEGSLGQVFPEAVTGDNLVNLGSDTSNAGTGETEREEDVDVEVAAVVVQKLPNGNMVLFGRQELRVNFEVREVVVGGVIRPQDITSGNTIAFEQMAEARISYGGRGQLTDVQQPRYGSQVFDIIMPF